MEIVKLPPGEQAPKESDCIRIEPSGGEYRLVSSALFCRGDSEQAESIALVGGEPYRSYDEAEAAGLAWAAEHGVETLYVEVPGDAAD